MHGSLCLSAVVELDVCVVVWWWGWEGVEGRDVKSCFKEQLEIGTDHQWSLTDPCLLGMSSHRYLEPFQCCPLGMTKSQAEPIHRACCSYYSWHGWRCHHLWVWMYMNNVRTLPILNWYHKRCMKKEGMHPTYIVPLYTAKFKCWSRIYYTVERGRWCRHILICVATTHVCIQITGDTRASSVDSTLLFLVCIWILFAARPLPLLGGLYALCTMYLYFKTHDHMLLFHQIHTSQSPLPPPPPPHQRLVKVDFSDPQGSPWKLKKMRSLVSNKAESRVYNKSI